MLYDTTINQNDVVPFLSPRLQDPFEGWPKPLALIAPSWHILGLELLSAVQEKLTEKPPQGFLIGNMFATGFVPLMAVKALHLDSKNTHFQCSQCTRLVCRVTQSQAMHATPASHPTAGMSSQAMARARCGSGTGRPAKHTGVPLLSVSLQPPSGDSAIAKASSCGVTELPHCCCQLLCVTFPADTCNCC